MFNLKILMVLLVVPTFDTSRILQWVKNAGIDVIKWVAFRGFIIAVIGTLLPLALIKTWNMISQNLFEAVQGMAENGEIWNGSVVELTGLAGWLGTQLRLVEAVSIILTALAIRFVFSAVFRVS